MFAMFQDNGGGEFCSDQMVVDAFCVINAYILNCDIVNGLENRDIICLRKWYWTLGCRSVMDKY